MNPLFKLAAGLVVFFLATFALAAGLGLFDEAAVRGWIEQLHASPHATALVSLAVVGLLAADLLLPVPGGPLMILAGHLLGPVLGTVVSSIGGILAGAIGYGVCRWGGRPLFDRFVSPGQATRARRQLERFGVPAILIARALPIFPEVIACLAGVTRMNAGLFFAAFGLSTVVFAAAHALAGAYSSIQNPLPGVIVGLAVPLLGWLAWYLVRRRAAD